MDDKKNDRRDAAVTATARVCGVLEHHHKKQRGDVSRSERSEVRGTATAAITLGLASLSTAKSAGTGREEKKETGIPEP